MGAHTIERFYEMATIHQVTVNQTKYNIVEASAVKQLSLMSMVGSHLIFLSESTKSELDMDAMTALLITIPESDMLAIADLVLHQTIKHGGSELVKIDDFQGHVQDYIALVGEGVRVNLQPFFTRLNDQNVSKDNGAETEPQL